MPIDWSTLPISSIARHRLVNGAVLAGEPGPAVLLRGGQSEQAQTAHRAHDVEREVVVAVPPGGVRGDLGLRELAHRPAELLVLARQFEAGHARHANRAVSDC